MTSWPASPSQALYNEYLHDNVADVVVRKHRYSDDLLVSAFPMKSDKPAT